MFFMHGKGKYFLCERDDNDQDLRIRPSIWEGA